VTRLAIERVRHGREDHRAGAELGFGHSGNGGVFNPAFPRHAAVGVRSGLRSSLEPLAGTSVRFGRRGGPVRPAQKPAGASREAGRAVSWASGFRRGAHVRPQTARVHHAARQRGSSDRVYQSVALRHFGNTWPSNALQFRTYAAIASILSRCDIALGAGFLLQRRQLWGS
jgi:hypothetical protein